MGEAENFSRREAKIFISHNLCRGHSIAKVEILHEINVVKYASFRFFHKNCFTSCELIQTFQIR